ncbi:MAG: hypothetical protein JWP02_223 [Acidimicrobiales bacterium]|nr:hypothetical protein [Acidimicrobiales bacterium]
MPVMAIPRFERFFRLAADLDIDKNDLKRYNDFVTAKLTDLLIIGQVAAKANLRDIIEFWDLPVTKGLQERVHEFEKLDAEIELEPILERLAASPQLDLTLSEETEARLPALVGGMSVALARAFRIIDPNVRNPQTEQWERAVRLFDLLL